MLYPLSYEGLTCTFAPHAGQVSVRWARASYLSSDGMCRVPSGPASAHRPDTRADCTGGCAYHPCRAGSGRRESNPHGQLVGCGGC
jgi:hypothetical protein